MERLKHPSLATGMLARLNKTIPTPQVIYADEPIGGAGMFVSPRVGEFLIDGCDIDTKRGIIVVFNGEPGMREAEIVAHELRHLWQWHTGWPMQNTQFEYDGTGTLKSYCDAIKRYFTGSACEMDALLWSHKMAPSQTTEMWLGIIHGAPGSVQL